MNLFTQTFRPFLCVGLCIALIAVNRMKAADTKQASPVAPAAPVAPSVTANVAAVAPAGVPFETFRPIADRNIFDPNRVGHTSRSTKTEVARPTGDTIALVGTMRYEKGYFAFFDSTDANYKKAVHEGELIAEFKVSRVSAEEVDLVRDGKNLSLKVAQRLRRPLGGDWTVADDEPVRSDVVASAATATGSGEITGAANVNTSPPIPSDASETLKRLMEQRRKQLKE